MDNGRELANKENHFNDTTSGTFRNGESSAVTERPIDSLAEEITTDPSADELKQKNSAGIIPEMTEASLQSSQEILPEAALPDELISNDISQNPTIVVESDSEAVTGSHTGETETIDADSIHEEAHLGEYDNFTKSDFVNLLENLLKEEDLKKVDTILKQVKPHFDHIKEQEKHDALLKFVAEGGSEDDFEFRSDALNQQFDNLYRQLRDKRNRQLKEFEKSKEKNLAIKTSLLERLRLLVDSEETQASIEEVKTIQRDWKTTGAVAPQQGNNLWASYHALLERYYTNRSIYFELKELDRRKNLEAKLELCEKAEKLAQKEPSNAVIKELNELHEEYRHLGPVPREEQETIWQRFKAASDTLYSRRREQLEGVKKEMDINYAQKAELVAALEPFIAFDSQKISDWNEKTQAILEIQKQWNTIGPVSKEKAKDISKDFWHGFKAFFHHKNEFFRKLEDFRAKNLQSKVSLCEQVEALLLSEDVERSAEEVKKLQLEWKNIGPVPEKQKNQIFDRFKLACDAFFNRRRESRSETDRQFDDNLIKKNAVCKAIEDLASEHESDVSKLEVLKVEWASIGFVPRKNMHSIQKRYLDAINQFAKNADKLTGTQKEKVKLSAELDLSKNNPAAFKNIQHKEQGLRKKITQLENDIALWKNNIEFFSHSKTADKLREEFNQKIGVAETELKEAKAQIKMLNDF
ncbi:MAG: DUF349 domain-containing protein [Bacteroidota bacterium]